MQTYEIKENQKLIAIIDGFDSMKEWLRHRRKLKGDGKGGTNLHKSVKYVNITWYLEQNRMI